MKINEKTVLSSIALAIAAVGVLWYMTITLERYSGSNESEEIVESGEENEVENTEKLRNPPRFEDVESTPRNLPPGELDPANIVPTL